MFIRKIYGVLILLFFISFACGKKQDDTGKTQTDKSTFSWAEVVSIDKIPDFELKGMMNGKEFKVGYVNYEYWRGSEDNVINFTAKPPRQNCGSFEEDDSGFKLTKKAGLFKEGEFIKDRFSITVNGVVADFHYSLGKDNTKNVTAEWNCALMISEINDKNVKGKVAICFNDELKSWIAGTFVAVKCNN